MIDPRVEKPEAREDFKIKNLEKHILTNRASYVQAGLNIIEAYIKAGKPKQVIPSYGSFEEWSNLVRSALVWLNMADPNETRKRIEQNDPEKLNFIRIMNLWNEIHEEEDVTTSDIVTECNEAIEKKYPDSEYEFGQAFIEATSTLS